MIISFLDVDVSLSAQMPTNLKFIRSAVETHSLSAVVKYESGQYPIPRFNKTSTWNFELISFLSDVPFENSTDPVVNETRKVMTVPLTQRQSQLSQGQSLTLSGQVDYGISLRNCEVSQFFCIKVIDGIGSSFRDTKQDNNLVCFNITDTKICYPGEYTFCFYFRILSFIS